MNLKKLPNHVLITLSITLLIAGILLVTWLLGNMPGSNSTSQDPQLLESAMAANPVDGEGQEGASTAETVDTAADAALTDATAAVPLDLVVGLTSDLPRTMITATASLSYTALITNYQAGDGGGEEIAIYFDGQEQNAAAAYRYTFAATTRFDTIDPEISWTDLQRLWSQGSDPSTAQLPYTQIAVLTDTLPLLSTILGEPSTVVASYGSAGELTAAAWQEMPTIALVPFELLEPRLAVLAIDGQKPIENANKFDEASYPLVAMVYGHIATQSATRRNIAQNRLAQLPPGNRDGDRLTIIAMTGVTAMVRLTAAEMDKRGYGWPAEVVGPELATADITAISNEVPFVPGCKTDTRMDNLTFCSKPEYMEALTASGVDIIGLTGNHQNDFGRTDAVTSLDIYDAAGLPVYGGGRNKEEAFAPLYLEHNGNRLAFLGANSYGPTFAWATDDQPGSAEFDLNIMSATIRNIKELGRAEVVLAELQYQESYDVVPLVDQRQNFNSLIQAGADIVTGVQSHVPQAMEFTDGKLILYGLGNLYFDQMWSQTTREGLIVKHTIYNNRHISTQVLTTVLYDYGQPRWTTVQENRAILDRVYGASYW